MSDWPERTADEREAARLERERRRAGQPGFEADPSEPIEARRLEHPPADEAYDDEDEWLADDEVALGTRRVARRERVQKPRASTPAPAGAPSRPARTRHSLLGRALALILLAVAAAAIWFLVELFQPFNGSPHGRVTVTIPPHSGAQQVGNILAQDGVVSSAFFFNLRAALSGDRGKLLSGTYSMQLGMSYGAALKALTTPPPVAKTSNLTIIEGRTRQQIDTLLRDQKIGNGYLDDTRKSPLLDPTRYGAPRGTSSLEGFLFPNTYQLRDPISVPALVADQLKTFQREFATVNLQQPQSRHFTPYQVLIIASMVQAEAQTAHDRPLIASVIYNRLADHMPLQIDATTRYATGNYTKPLTQSELASPSPYNTRVHAGLTPTPIDNPGLAAIQAAAHPASTNYLYFVVKPCANGGSAFASSYSVFLHEVKQYYDARQKQGGRSPVHC